MGRYEVLAEAASFKVKTITITVAPGARLSSQKHERRADNWFVVEGVGVVTLDGQQRRVKPGAVDVGLQVTHGIQNVGDGDLVFVEVQHGDYFGEDDTIRLEDDYGRSAST